MAITAKNTTNKTTKTSTNTRRIRGTSSRKTAVPMARQKNIPAGRYRSRISKISLKKTMAGDEAVEIIYELTAPDGSVRKMREVIPCDSWAFDCFSDAMIAAGLEDGDDISDAVGVTEDVVLTYPDPHGLGHFSKRTPAAANSTPRAPADDEDDPAPSVDDEDEDDYLEDE